MKIIFLAELKKISKCIFDNVKLSFLNLNRAPDSKIQNKSIIIHFKSRIFSSDLISQNFYAMEF